MKSHEQPTKQGYTMIQKIGMLELIEMFTVSEIKTIVYLKDKTQCNNVNIELLGITTNDKIKLILSGRDKLVCTHAIQFVVNAYINWEYAESTDGLIEVIIVTIG